jgi:hypothetical protein
VVLSLPTAKTKFMKLVSARSSNTKINQNILKVPSNEKNAHSYPDKNVVGFIFALRICVDNKNRISCTCIEKAYFIA